MKKLLSWCGAAACYLYIFLIGFLLSPLPWWQLLLLVPAVLSTIAVAYITATTLIFCGNPPKPIDTDKCFDPKQWDEAVREIRKRWNMGEEEIPFFPTRPSEEQK